MRKWHGGSMESKAFSPQNLLDAPIMAYHPFHFSVIVERAASREEGSLPVECW